MIGTELPVATLRRITLFAAFTDEELRAIIPLIVTRSCARGSVIFLENDPGDALYLIQSGLVRISCLAQDGRVKTLAVLSDGDFFGEMALVDDQPRSATAEALDTTTLLVLYRRDFERLLSDHPGLARAVIKGLSRRLRATNEQLLDAVFLDVRSRVIKTLLALAGSHGKPHPAGLRIDLRLTHQELAQMVGTSRETVTRVLADLQDSGLIGWDGRQLVLARGFPEEGRRNS
ncbi:MAG TPA: Crp/Fnr family transcriptional regulator [Firmicutes bacterium]|nr:Crp/Fnr family transcriptional regulator [Bacillota bacterium]